MIFVSTYTYPLFLFSDVWNGWVPKPHVLLPFSSSRGYAQIQLRFESSVRTSVPPTLSDKLTVFGTSYYKGAAGRTGVLPYTERRLPESTSHYKAPQIPGSDRRHKESRERGRLTLGTSNRTGSGALDKWWRHGTSLATGKDISANWLEVSAWWGVPLEGSASFHFS